MKRPDIIVPINKLCQSMSSPIDSHWFSLKRLLRYLKGIIHFGLTLAKPEFLDLLVYYDVDYGSYPNDKRNTGAICVFFLRVFGLVAIL